MTNIAKNSVKLLGVCNGFADSQNRNPFPYVSLSNRGSETTYGDLQSPTRPLNSQRTQLALDFLPVVPLNSTATFLSFADASRANTPELRSQFGVLLVATVPQVSQVPCMGLLLDWKFGKSARVARSPLAAEAMAADEAVDWNVFLNLFFTEVFTGTPAHRAEPLFQCLRTTDAKSLYDNLVSESPNLADKHSLVSVRAAQEVLAPNQLHWAPTQLMRADGLTKMSAALLAESHKMAQEAFNCAQGGRSPCGRCRGSRPRRPALP